MTQNYYPLRKGFNDALGFYTSRSTDPVAETQPSKRNKPKRLSDKETVDGVMEINNFTSAQMSFISHFEL